MLFVESITGGLFSVDLTEVKGIRYINGVVEFTLDSQVMLLGGTDWGGGITKAEATKIIQMWQNLQLDDESYEDEADEIPAAAPAPATSKPPITDPNTSTKQLMADRKAARRWKKVKKAR